MAPRPRLDCVTGAFGFTGRFVAERLLVSREPPACRTRFREWVRTHGDELGRRYRFELARRFDRASER